MPDINLKEIPSEYIMPYAAHYMASVVEAVGHGIQSPADARLELKYVERFITRYSGVYARIAVSNEFSKLRLLSDEDMIKICKESVKEYEEETFG